MNSLNFKIVKSFIKNFFRMVVFFAVFFVNIKIHAWEIDFSKRQVDFTTSQDMRVPASQSNEAADTAIEMLATAAKPVEPSQEIVIMQTPSGFIPEKLQLTKGVTYRFHVVNLDPEAKNTSFLFDAFSQTHNTVYGKPKTFVVTPRAEGLFSYQSPETARQGQVMIVDDVRSPAAVKVNAEEFKNQILKPTPKKELSVPAEKAAEEKKSVIEVQDLLLQQHKE